ncbi:hypothetical protein LJB90_03670 [Eubacteriales bacterium OttesenSCG-928-G02]|nr:hypothetical protein [Eubacteriales bacterium OttesenSCG-928-G02]
MKDLKAAPSTAQELLDSLHLSGKLEYSDYIEIRSEIDDLNVNYDLVK